MSLLLAQAISDIQSRLSNMTKEEIAQELEVVRVTLINEGTKDLNVGRWFHEDAKEEN